MRIEAGESPRFALVVPLADVPVVIFIAVDGEQRANGRLVAEALEDTTIVKEDAPTSMDSSGALAALAAARQVALGCDSDAGLGTESRENSRQRVVNCRDFFRIEERPAIAAANAVAAAPEGAFKSGFRQI